MSTTRLNYEQQHATICNNCNEFNCEKSRTDSLKEERVYSNGLSHHCIAAILLVESTLITLAPLEFTKQSAGLELLECCCSLSVLAKGYLTKFTLLPCRFA